MQKVYESFPVEAKDAVRPAITFKPDVMPAGKKFPLIMFFHGWGESGKSGPVDIVTRYGPPKYLNAGFNLDAIVVCPQAADFSFQFNSIRWILLEAIKRYPIDTEGGGSIHLVGISAGGGGCWSAVANAGKANPGAPVDPNTQIKKLISSIVPLSSMVVPQDYEDPYIENVAGEAGVAVWSIAGAKDAKFAEQARYISRVQSNNPLKLPVELTGIANEDHGPGAWDKASDPNWKGQPFNSNIYDFMLRNAKNLRVKQPFPDPLPPPPPPVKTLIKEYTYTKSVILQLWSDGSVSEK